jgi:hypothetical protein
MTFTFPLSFKGKTAGVGFFGDISRHFKENKRIRPPQNPFVKTRLKTTLSSFSLGLNLVPYYEK